MTNLVPSYLKLHLGEDAPAARKPRLSSADQFWNAFSAATGWRVDRRHSEDSVKMLPAVEMDLMAGGPSDLMPAVVKENAAELAGIANAMAREIEELQSIVRRQEIELAAQATVQFAPSRSEAACEAVHQTLERAIKAVGFDAAAIYILDDETQYLQTRAVVGLPADRLTAEPRMLRGSRADLEAMVQDAVLMEDLRGHIGETWNAPEAAGAAVCTAIYKGDLPIGTLWLFADEPKTLGQSASAIAQLASAQITLELTNAAHARSEARHQKSAEAVGDVAAWQYSSLPVGNQLAPGWMVDGMIESPNKWSIGWHAWDVLPDGSLMIAMAEASDQRAGGAMIAATARAALVAHSGYRHTPHQMLQRIGDTLWQTSTADQLVSLLYARIDPETGEGEIAAAGEISGLIAGKHGYRPLVTSAGRPLASAIEIECFESTFHLEEGETLLTFGVGLDKDGIGQELVGCCLRSAMQSGQSPLAVLRREMAAFPNRNERGLLSLSRRRV
ncbi:MAG: SpoIIE family protein phosphatase [Planctomycetales bacterium]|nr:SpoIIE family protein phosphatase [Planctomycetales bacterium]